MKKNIFAVIGLLLIIVFVITAFTWTNSSADYSKCYSVLGCDSTSTPRPTKVVTTVAPTEIPPTSVPPTEVKTLVPPTEPVPTNTQPPHKPKKTLVRTFVYISPTPTVECISDCEFKTSVLDLLRRILVELQVMNLK
jgi:hypothetical protein